MQQEWSVSFNDIRYLSIECPDCRTRVVLDMKEISELARRQDDSFAPAECPGCLKKYDSAIRLNVNKLQALYEAMLPVGGQISFRSS